MAACMQGYKQQKAYIIAQNPLKSTVRNFWKLITDRKCGAVVSLSQLSENGEVVVTECELIVCVLNKLLAVCVGVCSVLS